MDADVLHILLNAVLESSGSSSSSSSEDSDLSSNCEEVVEKVPALERNEPARKRLCFKNYFEKEFLAYSQEEFLAHVHITKELFECLCEVFAKSSEFSGKGVIKAACATKHIAVFLWYLSHPGCAYRDLGQRFCLSMYTVERVIRRVCKFFSRFAEEVIQWPVDFQKEIVSDSFEEICGFPGVIGAIGTCYVSIEAPKDSKAAYTDKNGDHSIIVQAICDDSKRFLYVRSGLPGGRCASQVFKELETAKDLEKYCEDYFIVGNTSYPCLKNLLTPFRNESLTDAQNHYNEKIKAGCAIIDSAFELMKQRFPQLNTCKIKELNKLNQLVKACCALHNLSEIADMSGFVIEDPIVNSNRLTTTDLADCDSSVGVMIRDEVCQHLNRRQR